MPINEQDPVEGPRDATPLIPLLAHKRTRLPVAVYTTFVQRHEGDALPVQWWNDVRRSSAGGR